MDNDTLINSWKIEKSKPKPFISGRKLHAQKSTNPDLFLKVRNGMFCSRLYVRDSFMARFIFKQASPKNSSVSKIYAERTGTFPRLTVKQTIKR